MKTIYYLGGRAEQNLDRDRVQWNMCIELQVCLIVLQSKEFVLNLIQWNIIIEETKGILIYKAVLEING